VKIEEEPEIQLPKLSRRERRK